MTDLLFDLTGQVAIVTGASRAWVSISRALSPGPEQILL